MRGAIRTVVLLLACGALLAAGPLAAASPLKVNILFVGAHPDDESMAMATLSRYVLDRGAQAAIITATHGEGGGNGAGHEAGTALGILRVYEQRTALHEIGVQQLYYLNLPDFGFTASAQDTAKQWGVDGPQAKLVRLFRLLRPDVVVTMSPWPGGHGHHQYVAQLATQAFYASGREDAFPEQLDEEHVLTWRPKKLYYVVEPDGSAAPTTQMVTLNSSDVSPSRGVPYAQIKARSMLAYRTQGWDQPGVATAPRPDQAESFMLADSRVPTSPHDADLLAGTTLGFELQALPNHYYVARDSTQPVRVRYRNHGAALSDVHLQLSAPAGWEVRRDPAGSTDIADFTVKVPPAAALAVPQLLVAHLQAKDATGRAVTASNYAAVRVMPPLGIDLVPAPMVLRFEKWAHHLGLDPLLGQIPAEAVAVAGRTNLVGVRITNYSNHARTVQASLLAAKTSGLQTSPRAVSVEAAKTVVLGFPLAVPPQAEWRSVPIEAHLDYGEFHPFNSGKLCVVPTVDVQHTHGAGRLKMDGDFTKYGYTESHGIPFERSWGGNVSGPDDLSASFRLLYDNEFLYLALEVTDDVLVSNIEPGDWRALWRSDSVEIAIDPLGHGGSDSTGTTFKLAVAPFDTRGGIIAARYGDASPGPVMQTAPGLSISTRRTPGGYHMEMAIPRGLALPNIKPGQSFGFNIMLYDCDKKDARPGENCNKGRIAWSAWPNVRATPRLWGEAVLIR